jgi:acyl-[acyl-carrier-protein] desaturase
MISRALREKFYRAYWEFFEHAEKSRRWSVSEDIPWDALEREPRNDKLALCAETFCGVEMYLPDYIIGNLESVQGTFGRTWFGANWGYEESKHALALREYLRRSGHRTEAQMFDFEEKIFSRHWVRPFPGERQMTIYAAIQERTTFVIYKKQEKLCAAEGSNVLAQIYKLIARDEMAHTRFYEDMAEIHLAEDRAGTLADLAYVFRNFKMPAADLVPDYDSRVEVMRTAGIDRGVFLTEVWAPTLKALKLTRHDLPRATPPAPTSNAPSSAASSAPSSATGRPGAEVVG